MDTRNEQSAVQPGTWPSSCPPTSVQPAGWQRPSACRPTLSGHGAASVAKKMEQTSQSLRAPCREAGWAAPLPAAWPRTLSYTSTHQEFLESSRMGGCWPQNPRGIRSTHRAMARSPGRWDHEKHRTLGPDCVVAILTVCLRDSPSMCKKVPGPPQLQPDSAVTREPKAGCPPFLESAPLK